MAQTYVFGSSSEEKKSKNWNEMITWLKAQPGCPDLSKVKFGDVHYLGKYILADSGLHAGMEMAPSEDEYWQPISVDLVAKPCKVGDWEPMGFRVMQSAHEPFLHTTGEPYVLEIIRDRGGVVSAEAHSLHTDQRDGVYDPEYCQEAERRWQRVFDESRRDRGEWWMANFGYYYDGRLHAGDRRIKEVAP